MCIRDRTETVEAEPVDLTEDVEAGDDQVETNNSADVESGDDGIMGDLTGAMDSIVQGTKGGF